jgi:hypothetical protein
VPSFQRQQSLWPASTGPSVVCRSGSVAKVSDAGTHAVHAPRTCAQPAPGSTALAPTRAAPLSAPLGTVRLDADALLHKYGSGDGDLLSDWLRSRGLDPAQTVHDGLGGTVGLDAALLVAAAKDGKTEGSGAYWTSPEGWECGSSTADETASTGVGAHCQHAGVMMEAHTS